MRVLFYTALSMAAFLAGNSEGVELQTMSQGEMEQTYDFFPVDDVDTFVQLAAEAEADKEDNKKAEKKKDDKKKDSKKVDKKKKDKKKDSKKKKKKGSSSSSSSSSSDDEKNKPIIIVNQMPPTFSGYTPQGYPISPFRPANLAGQVHHHHHHHRAEPFQVSANRMSAYP